MGAKRFLFPRPIRYISGVLRVSTDTIERLQKAAELALQATNAAQAEPLLRQLLAMAPQHAVGWHWLGIALSIQGRTPEAFDAISKSVALNPKVADAWHDLGAALCAMNRPGEARTAFEKAVAADPKNLRGRQGLAFVLKHELRYLEAAEECRKIAELDPRNSGIWFEIGLLLRTAGKAHEAVDAFKKGLALDPKNGEARHDLGIAYEMTRQYPEAIESFQRCLAACPTHVGAFNNMGNVLKFLGRLSEAEACYKKGLAINPQSSPTMSNYAALLILMGRCEEAAEHYRRALALDPGFDIARNGYLYCLQYIPDLDRRFVFEEHRQWEKFTPTPPPMPHPNERSPDRRLKIGYVSSDFRTHSVAFFMESILAGHNRKNVEVFCYGDVLPDAMTGRLQKLADHWRFINGISALGVAQMVQQDAIDILVDLNGHTAGSRLKAFSLKPAPVQVSYLGYPYSTGLSTIDYRFTDAVADPPPTSGSRNEDPDCFYIENLMRLPDCFHCFAPPNDAPPAERTAATSEKLRSLGSGLTFASFNALPKLSKKTISLWSRLMRELPDAHLLLKTIGLEDEAVRARLTKEFAHEGIEAGRFTLLNQTPTIREHLALYQHVDIALDSFPYHGTTTTCEALWMGVPVVTLSGNTHASRVSASLLTAMKLPELIARTPEEFIAITMNLARDGARLAELRRTLRPRMQASPLMDQDHFAKNLEAAYRQMWRAWCSAPA